MNSCSCTFHSHNGSIILPIPVLFCPPNAERTFWVWLVRLFPKRKLVVIDNNGNLSKVFSSFLSVCRHVNEIDKLHLTDKEVTRLANSGMMNLGQNRIVTFNEALLRDNEVSLIPEDYGQSHLCCAWKTSTKFSMLTKRSPSQMPISPNKRVKLVTGSYDWKEMGGFVDQVSQILKEHGDEWHQEVIEELIHQDARPKLYKVVNRFQKSSNNVPHAECIFIHPSGRLVPNIYLPCSVLHLQYGL